MSASINSGPSNSAEGPSRKRRLQGSKSLNSKDDMKCYGNISFRERASTGRPGSPHRYFEHSYDVSFGDRVDDVSSSLSNSVVNSNSEEKVASLLEAEATAAISKADDTDITMQSITTSNNMNSEGNQVVHRHVNGLCIITAGNILKTTLQQQIQNKNDDKSQQDINQSISSIQYLVKPAPDAQSAKGKLRAKNKKRKKDNSNKKGKADDGSSQSQTSNDGDVSPYDTLCEVTLANGEKVLLKCCVQGTIIELNRRLSDVDASNSNSGIGNASLLLSDPLLDGYLAVIMPNRGTRLPTIEC